MSIGTFVGARLRDARTARSMTASVLAERVGVSPGAISQYELRNTEPRPATLAGLARVLELPQAHFLRPEQVRDPAPHLYRSTTAATKRARESAEARQSWLREIAAAIETHVEFPSVNLVRPGGPMVNPMTIRDQEIEELAGEVRHVWRLGEGPIPDLVGLLELMGCIVSAFAFGAEELSAFSQAASERPYVILNADETSCARWRFNAGHELGHLILHGGVPSNEAARPEVHKVLERQAHRFAAALLFPAAAFADEVYSLSLDALEQVKSRWRVSMQMILRRARDLDLVSQDRYERAFRELSRRGFRRKEPLDDTLPVEQPRLLSRSIEMLVAEHVVTRDDLLHKLPFSQMDIEVLAGLPRGYLASSSWGEVAQLNLREQRPRASDETGTSQGGGKVLRFRPKAP